MRKARPGVCGVCGCAVMRSPKEPQEGTRNGHTYKNGEVVKVRCKAHGGFRFEIFPGADVFEDENGCFD